MADSMSLTIRETRGNSSTQFPRRSVAAAADAVREAEVVAAEQVAEATRRRQILRQPIRRPQSRLLSRPVVLAAVAVQILPLQTSFPHRRRMINTASTGTRPW